MSPTAQSGVDVADLDRQNGATLGRILGRGSVGEAEAGPDGKMRATVRIPEDELVFEPGIIVLPHAGELELTLSHGHPIEVATCRWSASSATQRARLEPRE